MDVAKSEIVRREEGPLALARSEEWDQGIAVERIVARVKKIQEVQSRVMQSGHHYGVIPGTGNKPSLLKPGAELLSLTFQLDPQFHVEDHWDGDHLESVVTCTLYHAPTGTRVGSGIGSCSTKESKYAYRKGERLCPECGKPAIIKGKSEYGGGWVCFDKKGGCKAKFKENDAAIVEQATGRIPNPDLPDQYNTVRKMGCKRAHVAAILFVTCASEIFTQDIEDMPHAGDSQVSDGNDEAPRGGEPQRQERGSSQGQRDNRQQQSGNRGSANKDSAEATAKLLKLVADAADLAALEELLPEINMLKGEQVLTVNDYRSLRDAYGARAKSFGSDQRQSA